MGSNAKEIENLKTLIQKETRTFCRLKKTSTSEALTVLRKFRDLGIEAVFFGGALRSLILSRLEVNKPGRPRDLDLVCLEGSKEILRSLFPAETTRVNSFGGLQAQVGSWQFDVWPLKNTWAFLQDGNDDPGFEDLPYTTFLNLEALAVEVWPTNGTSRRIYSGDDQFFEGIINKTIELNRENNPYPLLGALRAFVLASRTGFKLGPRLVEYINSYAGHVMEEEFEAVQRKHYGTLYVPGELLCQWVSRLSKARPGASFLMVFESQLEFPRPNLTRMHNNIDLSSLSDDFVQCEENEARTGQLSFRFSI